MISEASGAAADVKLKEPAWANAFSCQFCAISKRGWRHHRVWQVCRWHCKFGLALELEIFSVLSFVRDRVVAMRRSSMVKVERFVPMLLLPEFLPLLARAGNSSKALQAVATPGHTDGCPAAWSLMLALGWLTC